MGALAEDYGYPFAGGCAVQAHRIVDRLSDDVDLFAPIDREWKTPGSPSLIRVMAGAL
ncbi:hypothetical protein GCM10010442_53510 [Kitasatospora kifunensis]